LNKFKDKSKESRRK